MIGLATGALLAAVWQGVLLAAVVWLGLRMLPKTPAAVRFAIWFGVFLVVTVLPLASLWPHAPGAMRVGGRGAWMTLDMRWSLAIAAVWGAASLVRAAKLVVAAVRVRGLWKRAKAVEVAGADGIHPTLRDTAAKDGAPELLHGSAGRETNTEILSFAQNDGAKFNDGTRFRKLNDGTRFRRAELCVSDEVDRPTVIGFFAPKILIPGWLLEKLTAAELEQIVLHEASHLGRADDWMNLLQKVALVIFPLNPALAWVERRLCFERELAVDERVLRAFGGKAVAATAYASCLVTVAGHRLGRRGLALALGALGRESELGRRVGRILRRGEMMRPTHARLVLGGALLLLLGASVELERCPQLVGFAAGGSTVARADVLNVDGPLASQVMLHKDDLRAGVGVPHEVLMRASMGSAVGTLQQADSTRVSQSHQATSEAGGVGSLVASERQPTLRDEAAKDGPPRFLQGTPRLLDGLARLSGQPHAVATKAEQQPTRVMQWVVVTEWQGSDGARMVLTTATTENPAVKGQRVQSDTATAPEQDSEQVHPYAAVLVRGGWLVFQL
jgi:BlaR1 peptidase M56